MVQIPVLHQMVEAETLLRITFLIRTWVPVQSGYEAFRFLWLLLARSITFAIAP
jgi:hypothetical protein